MRDELALRDIDFESLYRREYPGLYGVAHVLVGDDAEDLVHDAMLRALLQWGRVRRLERPGGWCHRVLVNRCRSWWRRRRTREAYLARQRRAEPFAVPMTTTTVASTTTTTEASTTTISPVGGTAAPGVPTDQAALVLAGAGRGSMSVLGGWNGTSWAGDVRTSPITSVSAIGPGLGDEVVTGLDLGPEGPESDVCLEPTREAIDFGREVTDDNQGSTVLAVTADWPLQPRPEVRAGLDAPVYQQVGESVVAGHDGVDPTKGDVTEVIRADLDGDGSEEVVFGFEYFSARASGVARGDFSVVIARFARPDGTVRDQPLVEYYAQGFDAYGDLAFLAIADLNGDGVMEVALRAVFWEGSAVTVYALQDGGLTAVLGSGCSN